MPRNTTPSFVLTLKLNTSATDERELEERFRLAARVRNRMTAFAIKRVRGLRQDLNYRNLMALRKPLVGKDDKRSKSALADINEKLSEIRMQYGLSEYQFHGWIVVQQHKYKTKLDSNTTQRIASNVWQGVEKVLFGDGKKLHFKPQEKLHSLSGKTNASGIRFSKGKLRWNGLCIQPQIRKGDDYAREALTHRVKYCRILREPMGQKVHWYLQLVLEGTPPKQHSFLLDGRVGIDQGTSTEAIVSEQGCILTELCPERPNIQKKVRKIQRRMDRSARACNPENFREDGTVKRHVKWNRSKAWKRDRMRLRVLYRRAADTAAQDRDELANRVLCEHGSDIITEEMDYKALQKRAKETQVSEKTGRYKRKKRFGASIGRHAPAAFMAVLGRKLAYIEKAVYQVDTKMYKASRYRHDTGEYEAHSLSDREKFISGHHVQRDLYSAFLLMCASDPETPDREMCQKLFEGFKKNEEAELLRLLKEDKKHPSCMGLQNFEYLLPA